jgi:hypothetical protein
MYDVSFHIALNDEVFVTVVSEKSERVKMPNTVREERPETELLSWAKTRTAEVCVCI